MQFARAKSLRELRAAYERDARTEASNAVCKGHNSTKITSELRAKKNSYTMNYSRFTHPGVILKDNIYSLGLTPLTFSRIANLPVWTVEGIINGTKDITPTIADALERGTAVPASFWMVRQRNYDACKPRDVVPNERNS